ncbi:CHAT domain-containing protein [Actinomadura opuntiae]|uniref:CHAT domain-containing protein n=1 Tax=Actinomadura sp. OS1-43 TaxID=604315 RepID=UPI00255B2F93|nr:CHAT domain-containing protein [Actinomadura sp. OS1-43]MDL4815007.1 CHAT domain-containing protein [Actinomadura sp. OS1-43]
MTGSWNTGDFSDAAIAALRARLASAAPGDRPDALAALGRALSKSASFGAGDAPDAADRAAEAIALYREGVACVPPDDARLPALRFELGNLLAIRYLRVAGAEADRDEAIDLFEQCLADDPDAVRPKPETEPETGAWSAGWRLQTAGVWLGVLLMFRVLRLPVPLGERPPDLYDLAPLMTGLSAIDSPDVQRAVAVLTRFADADDIDPELGRVAVVLRAVAVLFQVYNTAEEDDVDLSRAMALLDQAGERLDEGDPGHREVVGLSVFLEADARRERGEQGPPDPRMVADLERAIELEPGDMLKAALEMQLGAARMQSWLRTGDPADLAEGPELVERAHEHMRARGDDHPLYEDGLRWLAGLTMGVTAFQPTPGGVEKVISLAEQVRARRDPGDRDGRAKDTYLLGMATMLKAALTGGQDDWTRASRLLETALRDIRDEDPLAVTMLTTYGSVLLDRHTRRGGIEEAEAARRYLERAEVICRTRRPPDGDEFEWRTVQGLLGAVTATCAWRDGDEDGLRRAVENLREAQRALPGTYPWRSRLDMELGRALMRQADVLLRAGAGEALDAAREGAALLAAAMDADAIDAGNRQALRAVGGLARVLDGVLERDLAAMDEGIARLGEAAAVPEVLHGQRAGVLWSLGAAHLVRSRMDSEGLHRGADGPADAASAADHRELGVARLEQAAGLLAAEPASPMTGRVLWELAGAYRGRGEDGDAALAISAGFGALRARIGDVLLQTGVEYGLATARGVAEMAQRVARWCVAEGRAADAAEAVELGRGLVLYAATSATAVSELLRGRGFTGLADEWDEQGAVDAGPPPPHEPAGAGGAAQAAAALAGPLLDPQVPGDLRQRVLDALHRAGDAAALTAAPEPARVAAALAAVGADLLVYLVPGEGGEPGLLLVADRAGVVRVVAAPALRLDDERAAAYVGLPGVAGDGADWRDALDAVGAWAWSAAFEPLLADAGERGIAGAPRVVLVPCGALGGIPWQVAYRTGADGGRGYACREFVLSYAASARQFVTAAGRRRRDPLEDPVFVADPTGELKTTAELTHVLRHVFYPDARGLGRTRRPGEPSATPEEVRAHVPGRRAPGASMLQLTCHGVTTASAAGSHVKLVDAAGDPAQLRADELLRRSHRREPDAPGGLVVLSTCVSDVTPADHDEALTLATSFQTAGAAAVVGSRWRVAGSVTPLLMFMFHRALVLDGADPVDALRAAQLWMLDPDRPIPPEMPEDYAWDAGRLDLADPVSWGAFTHQGN